MGDKGVYGDDEEKGQFDFELNWDPIDELNLRTACCCCVCAFDDCEDWMQVQVESVCLWVNCQESCRCCQCGDESGEALACSQGVTECKCLSMTDQEQDMPTCVSFAGKGVSCCCAVGTAKYACCDPCGAPESCLKAMAQVFCIHLRAALPCDEDVPFEISCCGINIAGGPEGGAE